MGRGARACDGVAGLSRCPDRGTLPMPPTRSLPRDSCGRQVDPSLARTVVVSTKLDVKFGQVCDLSYEILLADTTSHACRSQFGQPDELRTFISAADLRRRHPRLLGGPFFTTVPAAAPPARCAERAAAR